MVTGQTRQHKSIPGELISITADLNKRWIPEPFLTNISDCHLVHYGFKAFTGMTDWVVENKTNPLVGIHMSVKRFCGGYPDFKR